MKSIVIFCCLFFSFVQFSLAQEKTNFGNSAIFQILGNNVEILRQNNKGNISWQTYLELPQIKAPASYVFHMGMQGIYALDSLGGLWLLAEKRENDWNFGVNYLGTFFPKAENAILTASGADSLWVYNFDEHRLYSHCLTSRKTNIVIDTTPYRLLADWIYLPQEGVFYVVDEFLRFMALNPQEPKIWERKLMRDLIRYSSQRQMWLLTPRSLVMQIMPSGQWSYIDLETFNTQRIFSLANESLRRPPKNNRSWAVSLEEYNTENPFNSPFIQWEIQAQSDGSSFMLKAIINRQGRWDLLFVESSNDGKVWKTLTDRALKTPDYETLYPFSYLARDVDADKIYYRIRLEDRHQLSSFSLPLKWENNDYHPSAVLYNETTLSFIQKESLSYWGIYDFLGNKIAEWQSNTPIPPTIQNIKIDKEIPKGVYQLKTNSNVYYFVK